LTHFYLFPYTTLFRSEPRTMACRNFNKVLLTIETFHGEHRVQTVARIRQVSTRNACNRLERRRFPQGHQRAISCQNELESCKPQDRKSTRLNSSHEWI